MKPRHLEQVGIEWRLRKKHFGDVGWLVGWLVGRDGGATEFGGGLDGELLDARDSA